MNGNNSEVALIIIYNHQHNDNVQVLESIYGKRFSHIFHLMPFYRGDRPNVFAVYGNSYYFQGFIAQGLRSFYRQEFVHYLFIADDLILNPAVNEHNYAELLNIGPETCFIPGIFCYHSITNGFWENVIMAYSWKPDINGIHIRPHLPSYPEAIKRFANHGLFFEPIRFEQIWQKPQTFNDWIKRIIKEPLFIYRYFEACLIKKRFHLSYPLVGSYSDIFAVSRDAIFEFAHYCGVFAAASLFVEHALPTSMVLSARKISTEHDLPMKGKALWTPEQMKELEPFGNSLKDLLDKFPEKYLYLHPVKLSSWNVTI